jgi:hypothetical protein
MAEEIRPIVGEWYKDTEGQIFEIVAMDEEENYIEIQYFGGEIDEMDFESWGSSVIENVEQPEDWSGPYDELERDDLGYTDTGMQPDGRSISYEDLE